MLVDQECADVSESSGQQKHAGSKHGEAVGSLAHNAMDDSNTLHDLAESTVTVAYAV